MVLSIGVATNILLRFDAFNFLWEVFDDNNSTNDEMSVSKLTDTELKTEPSIEEPETKFTKPPIKGAEPSACGDKAKSVNSYIK